ncbi:MAG: BolA/IbaG family iron-sulfur metabolism protein [Planctomycetia bacterium]|nr:BolA/IbaG family iron-sulfur metabolism protein [Planctomycetia bacterium]
MVRLKLKRTAETKKIEKLLLKHFPDHPQEYPPSAYRYNPASIRVRVVSDRFDGMDRVERSDLVYPILKNNLSEDTWQDIMLIILLTPKELEDSVANREFEKPTPSRI